MFHEGGPQYLFEFCRRVRPHMVVEEIIEESGLIYKAGKDFL